MSEVAADNQVVYDVIVDFGNGTHVKIENGMSATAAQIASKRVSKFFQGVLVVERLRGSRPCRPSNTSRS